MRPSAGLTPNCTLEPPVSTPISRSTAIEASRMIWYSLSVSVSAGATVMESRMYAHWVNILNGADDNAIIGFVAHHFHFIFFPAQQRLINQHFMGGRGIKAGGNDLIKLR